MRILAIDPGFSVTGFAVVDSSAARQHQVLQFGHLKYSQNQSTGQKILKFSNFVTELIEKYNTQLLAVETPFLGKNAQTFVKLGFLRGHVHYLAARQNLGIAEVSPAEVKKAICNNAHATKEQLAKTLTLLFGVQSSGMADSTDALGLAICVAWNLPKMI